MAVDEREGAFLYWLRRLAPGVGLALLAIAGAGWLIGPWEEVPLETAALATPSELGPDNLLVTARPVIDEDIDWLDLLGLEDPAPAPEVAAALADPTLVAVEPPAAVPALPPEPTPQPLAAPPPPVQPAEPPVVEVVAAAEPEPIAAAGPAPVIAARPPPPPIRAPFQQRAGIVSYTVAPGETLSGIAARHGVSVETVRAANSLGSDGRIRSGQTLQVPTADGVVHVVEPGETLLGIAASHGTDRQAVAAANGLDRDAKVRSGQRLVVPGEPRGPVLASRPIMKPTPTPKRPTPKPTASRP